MRSKGRLGYFMRSEFFESRENMSSFFLCSRRNVSAVRSMHFPPS